MRVDGVLLVARRDRRKLLRNLRHVAGVFNDASTPSGWVEIQALDVRESGPDDLPEIDDVAAALLVAEAGGEPTMAYAYFDGSGVLAPLVWNGGCGELDLSEEETAALERLSPSCPSWRAVVTATAARKARLITKREEARAQRGT